MNRRSAAIGAIWIFLLAWWSRFYKIWVGSPLPSTFGVHIDWARFHLAKTGTMASGPTAYTSLVNLAGRQARDLSSWFLAIVNVVTGTEGLIEGLTLLNAVSLSGLILFPVTILAWYWSYPGERRYGYWLLVLALVLFPGPTMIDRTTEGWLVVTFPMFLMLLSVLIIARLNRDRRGYALLILFAGLVFTMHHTWALIYFLIVSIIVVIYSSPLLVMSVGRTRSGKITILSTIVIFLVFFLVGTHWRPRFEELVVNLHYLYYGGGPTLAKSQFGSEYLSRQNLYHLNIRRILKILNHISGISIIALYIFDRLYITDIKYVVYSNQDRVLLSALAAFPLIIGIFASMGSISFIIYRTRYIGIFFVLLAAALLLQSDREFIRRGTIGLAVLMIVTAMAAAPLIGVLEPLHTDRQAESVEWAGEKIPNDKYIFTGNRLGTPLIYYDQRGVSIIRSIHSNWTERIAQVYFDDDPRATKRAIIATIQSSQIAGAPPVDGHYLIYSKAANREGIQLLSFSTKPVTHPPPRKFNRYPKYNKIYTDNATMVYQSLEFS